MTDDTTTPQPPHPPQAAGRPPRIAASKPRPRRTPFLSDDAGLTAHTLKPQDSSET